MIQRGRDSERVDGLTRLISLIPKISELETERTNLEEEEEAMGWFFFARKASSHKLW
jgi:hypothetical protein